MHAILIRNHNDILNNNFIHNDWLKQSGRSIFLKFTVWSFFNHNFSKSDFHFLKSINRWIIPPSIISKIWMLVNISKYNQREIEEIYEWADVILFVYSINQPSSILLTECMFTQFRRLLGKITDLILRTGKIDQMAYRMIFLSSDKIC